MMIDPAILDDVVSQLLDAGDDTDAVNCIDADLRGRYPTRANVIFNAASKRTELINRFSEGDRVTWYAGPVFGDQAGTVTGITPTGPVGPYASITVDGSSVGRIVPLEDLTATKHACPAYAQRADGTCSVCDDRTGWLGDNTTAVAA